MNPLSFDEIMNVQRMMASRVMNENSMDNKIKLLGIIRDLSKGPHAKVQVEQILYEAQMEGFMEAETMAMIDELKKDNMLVEAADGSLILT